MTFWNTATQEQKLAQIDGGIECGMNSTQIAMNCGTDRIIVIGFAHHRGRKFPHDVGAGKGVLGRKHIGDRLRVEHAKRRVERTGDFGDAAFSIFDNHSEAFELEWPA